MEGSRPRCKPERTCKEVVQDCQACKLSRQDAMDRNRCIVVVVVAVVVVYDDDDLFVKVHVYECHNKQRGFRHITSMAKFTCRHCGSGANSLAAHCSHLAHHQSQSAELIRFFSCVYCDCLSDNIEVLEEHVARYHPNRQMKFEVQQSSVTYLQASGSHL